jgi:serine/threonine-protein kinase
LETDPEAGAKVYVGDTLSATISAGSRFVEVPDMRGMTVDKAKIMLDSLGLELDPRMEYERDPDVEKGMVLKQIPEPRTRVERKTEIRVVVSSGKERVKPKGEDSTKYLYTVRIELSDITEQVMLRVDMTDARGTKTIDERERQPGELVELTAEGYGGEALFRIYYNGELVTQVKREPDEPLEEN